MIRRVTMHQSALRLAHACERQGRTIAELPSVPGVGPAGDTPRPRRAPAKRKTKAKRR